MSPFLDDKSDFDWRSERRRYWRSLAELAGDDTAPIDAVDQRWEGVSRRDFLQLLGASMALAGVAGCTREPAQKILPYTLRPNGVLPGRATHYATSMVVDGFATGLLVESHEGRPTKIEGNPEHPASLGAAGVREQASVLQLYDPHRGHGARDGDRPLDWRGFVERFGAPRTDGGAGLRFVLPPIGSPLLEDLVARVLERHPKTRFVFHAPFDNRNAIEGARLAFGEPLQVQLDLSRADVILALDADLVGTMPPALRHARQFADRRRSADASMNRLYVVEAAISTTGSMADHRLRVPPSEIRGILVELLGALASPGGLSSAHRSLAAALPVPRPWVQVVARDLLRHRGAALVAVGERQAADVHALGHVINQLLGAQGRTVKLTAPTRLLLDDAAFSLVELTREIDARAVQTLVTVGENPVYTAPADLELARRFRAVPESIALALYENETAEASHIFLPQAHYLESWGDGRAFDGTLGVVQPLIAPLWSGHTDAEVLAVFAGEAQPDAYTLLRERWNRGLVRSDGEWHDVLRRGLLPGTRSAAVQRPLSDDSIARVLQRSTRPLQVARGLELDLALSPTLYDGRFANAAWLLELPDPITKLTWDNAALISPSTAAALGVRSGQWLRLSRNTDGANRSLRAPAFVVPGQADHTVTLHVGWGRRGAEELAHVGVNAFALSTSEMPLPGAGITVEPLAEFHPLAVTQTHWTMQGRPVAITADLADYRRDPDFLKEHKGAEPSLLAPRSAPSDVEQWAMSIDLSVCIGCNACVVACQAENNVLVVGKKNVLKSREMHWLRVDTYFYGDASDPQVVHQPMACQHCESAPCEYVCPVNATVHSPDGLNEMVYNRCVGTRFCSNNCPYKVRRFNWFNWLDHEPANQGLVKLQRNPEVTVRERGVMEKCTYCVQRIRVAESVARVENRSPHEMEVQTACAQTCPTHAISFGSLTRPDDEVNLWRAEPRSYEVLHDQNTRPRTQYLARINNPNPEMP